MNLNDMRAIVRRDLHDEDESNYRWTDDELNGSIAHAVKDFSEAVPYEQKTSEATASGSREIDISAIADRIMVEAVEYPVDKYPRRYRRFSVWGNTLTLLSDEVPDGSDANIYYGKIHTLDAGTSTIPSMFEDLISTGACAYAAIEWSVFAINRVNVGGTRVSDDFIKWGTEKGVEFRREIKRLGRKNRIRTRRLYEPYYPTVSKSTDYGP